MDKNIFVLEAVTEDTLLARFAIERFDVTGDLEISLKFLNDSFGAAFDIPEDRIGSNLWFSSAMAEFCVGLPWFVLSIYLPEFLCNRYRARGAAQKRIATITEPLLDRLDFDIMGYD